MRCTGRILRKLVSVALAIALGGFLAATMMRIAPGAESDERLLDPRLSPETLNALRQEHAASRNVFHFYFNYLDHAVHGDLGKSESLNQPIRTLLVERTPATAKLLGGGLLMGWMLATTCALITALSRWSSFRVMSTFVSGAFLCIPTAVLALLFVMWDGPAYLAVALVVFPRIYTYMRKLLQKAYAEPHLITARAKGISELRVLGWHVLPNYRTQLLALAGVSVNIALGAAIPIEALCGIPGIGQLAWQAALSRDLVLLVTLTVIVGSITMLANVASEFATDVAIQEPA